MDVLNGLRNEQRGLRLYRLRFAAPALEQQFREWQRQRYAPIRVILFCLLAIIVVASSWFDSSLFAAPAASLPLLHLLQWGIILPTTLAGAVISAARMDGSRQRALLTIVMNVYWSALVAIHALSLTDSFRFPAYLVGLALIATATFGGFTWQRVVSGVCIYTMAMIAIEFRLQITPVDAGFEIYCILMAATIAIAGSYTQELLFRLAWLNWRYARELAATDALTGLSNRHEFHRMFQRVLAQGMRDRRRIGVALIDLDHFKSINDRYGHLFGDHVLREIGRLLQDQVARRPFDLRARYGGEEIAIVWYDVKADALPALMDAVLDGIRALPFADPRSGEPLQVTASAGLCWTIPTESDTAERLLHAADVLLYRAKAEGRDGARLAPFVDEMADLEIPGKTDTRG